MRVYKMAWLPMLAVSLSAAPLNLNTGGPGVTLNGVTTNWTVTQTSGNANSVPVGTSVNAVALAGALPFASNLPGFEQFGWANPQGGGVWIGQLSTDGQFNGANGIACQNASFCGAASGTYVYSISFAGGYGGSFTLTNFTGDNGITELTVTASNGLLYQCDQSLPGNLCAANQTQLTGTTGLLTYGSGGTVTITATVINNPLSQTVDRNSSGFILSGSGNALDTPEPSTYAMLGLGAVAMLAARLRRK